MWVNFRKLNAHIRQLHCKHAASASDIFFILFLVLVLMPFFALSCFAPGRPCSVENCVPLFSSPSPQSPQLPTPASALIFFFAQRLQFDIWVIATSKLENEQIIAVDFVTEVK